MKTLQKLTLIFNTMINRTKC